MKRTAIYTAMILVFLFSAGRRAAAQSDPSYKGTIKTEPVRLIQSGETLHVEMDFVMENVKVRSTGAVDLIPMLVSPTDTLTLPKVSVKGRNEYLTYERIQALMSGKELDGYEQPYAVQKNTKAESLTIPYRYTVPFEPWMKDARLEVQRDECGCGQVAWMTRDILDPVSLDPVPYIVRPLLAYIQPEAEVKQREKQVETFLDFVVNKTDIRPDYMNNPAELAKIHSMIDELHDDTDITINRLDIMGYASPEGPYNNNRRLSEGRANALKSYLASKYSFPSAKYNTVFGGENWDGLRSALAGLDIEHKAEIEQIVNYYVGQDRKNRLQGLAGGAPYQWLLQNVYPGLRVAICKVEYGIKNFNLQEAREVFKVRPQNLSLNEMYVVANSYPTGSREFIDVFETAARLYPEESIARLNAASSALSRGDVETGERFLSDITERESAEYLNAAGVLAMLKGDYETAERLLNLADDAGLEAARHNLGELATKVSNENEIRKRTEYNKRH